MNRLSFLLSVALIAPFANAQLDQSIRQISHDIFKQLIEINTTDSVGNVTPASEGMAQRFRDAGFPETDLFIGGPNDRKKNLVARLHGSGRHKPVLIGHLDVVEAKREDWTTDPFSVRGEGRLLLRPRHARYERRRHDHGHDFDSIQEGGLCPRS